MKDFNKLFIIIVICLISNITNAFQLVINSQVQYVRPPTGYVESKDQPKPPVNELFNFPPGEKVTVMGEWVGTNIGLPFIFHPIYINNGGIINAQISWGNLNAPDYIYFEIEMENELAKVVFPDTNNNSWTNILTSVPPIKYRTGNYFFYG